MTKGGPQRVGPQGNLPVSWWAIPPVVENIQIGKRCNSVSVWSGLSVRVLSGGGVKSKLSCEDLNNLVDECMGLIIKKKKTTVND